MRKQVALSSARMAGAAVVLGRTGCPRYQPSSLLLLLLVAAALPLSRASWLPAALPLSRDSWLPAADSRLTDVEHALFVDYEELLKDRWLYYEGGSNETLVQKEVAFLRSLGKLAADAEKLVAHEEAGTLDRRRLLLLRGTGAHKLPDGSLERYARRLVGVEDSFARLSRGKLCFATAKEGCLDGAEVRKQMKTAVNLSHAEVLWALWRNVTTALSADAYDLLQLRDQAAAAIGFRDAASLHRERAEVPRLRTLLQSIREEVSEVYRYVHGAVRKGLREYTKESLGVEDHIPEALLGDLQGERWTGVFRMIPEGLSVSDLSDELSLDLTWMTRKAFEILGEWDPKLDQDYARRLLNDSLLDYPLCVSRVQRSQKKVRMLLCNERTWANVVRLHDAVVQVYVLVAFPNQENLTLPYYGSSPVVLKALSTLLTMTLLNPENLRVNAPSYLRELPWLLHLALLLVQPLQYALVTEEWRKSSVGSKEDAESARSQWWAARMQHLGVCGDSGQADRPYPWASPEAALKEEYISDILGVVLGFQLHAHFCGEMHTSVHSCNLRKSEDILRRFRLVTGNSSAIEARHVRLFFAPLVEHLKRTQIPIGWKEPSVFGSSLLVVAGVVLAFICVLVVAAYVIRKRRRNP